jgi:hypothetical protein
VIIVVPALIPYTTPRLQFMVATLVLVLVQMPPETESYKVIDEPAQTVVGPVMEETGLTWKLVVAEQPEPIV